MHAGAELRLASVRIAFFRVAKFDHLPPYSYQQAPPSAERACMTVNLKTPEDIAGMRVAGKLAADVLEMIAEHVKPGVTTDELNQICHDYIVNVQQAIPAPLNYKGYPKSICTSINHVVCHGIPNDKPLKNGDTLNIDVTVIKGRLPRRHQPYVPCRRSAGLGRTPVADHPGMHVQGDRDRQTRLPPR
jgi:methionine aminopeptidase